MVDSYMDILHTKLNCKIFINLGLYDFKPFSPLAKLLNNKDVLYKTKIFLKIFMSEDKIETKKFLSCFMIKHHPNVIISDKTTIEKNVIKYSDMLLNNILSIYDSQNKFSMNFYISRLKINYQKYITMFDLWKKYDKQRIINDLSTIYFELEHDKNKRYDDIDDHSNYEFIRSIESEQKKLVDKIENIGGKEGLDYLEMLRVEIEKYKAHVQDLYTHIHDNLRLSYWNNINSELKKEPPNFKVVTELLTELKGMFIELNPTIVNELNENIDVEFIDEMIERQVIDDKYIGNMCNYIITLLKRCHSEVNDKELEEDRNKMNKELLEGIKNEDFFPKFFKFVFEKIDEIKKEKQIIDFIKDNINNS